MAGAHLVAASEPLVGANTVTGIYQGIYAAGNAVGSLIGGGLYTAIGPSGLFASTSVLLALTLCGLAIFVGLEPWSGGVGVVAGPYRRLGVVADGSDHDERALLYGGDGGEPEGGKGHDAAAPACGEAAEGEVGHPPCGDEETELLRRYDAAKPS